MAQDKSDADENKQEPEGEIAAPSGKKKFLIIGGVALLLVLGGVGAWLMLGDSGEAAEEAAAIVVPEPAIYTTLGEKFVVTLEEGSRQHYLQVSLSVMAREQTAIDELTLHEPLIRARLVSLLGTQDFSALRGEAGKLALREQILVAVQEILSAETGKPGIEQVFYTEFVLQ